MWTPENKRRFVIVAVFLVPVVLVKGTSVFYGVGAPAGASAAATITRQLTTEFTATAALDWSEHQRAAASHVLELREQSFGATPLYYQPQTTTTSGEESAQHVDPSLPNLMVQAILESATGATVLINNKSYRVGDMFEDTAWKIIAINNSTRTVTLENQNTGKSVDAVVLINR